MQRKNLSYADVGVDTDIEAEAARILYKFSKKTWINRAGKLGEPHALADNFSSVRFARIGNLPAGTLEWGNADGVGTKPEIARLANRYDTIATDLVAMVADDAAILGAEPAHLKTILKVNTLGQDKSRLPYIEKLAKGYVSACADAGVAVINGELAQHNDVMGSVEEFRFEWDATLTWYAHESRLLDGSAIQAGDYLIGLREEGLRCNGISLVRAVLTGKHGNEWSEVKLGKQPLADLALRPSRIYAKAIVDMTGGYDLSRQPRALLHGAAHITGGGMPEKLHRRLLSRHNLGAVIDDPFEPSELFTYCQEVGGVSDREAYKAWNMGQGMVLIAPSFEEILKVCAEYDIEAKAIGRVVHRPGMTIHSRGVQRVKLQF